MRTLGKIFSDKEFNEKKTKENGYLELDKFLNLMADIKTEENALKIEQTNLINTFAYLDRNQNEIIDYNEFKHILTMISKKFCPKEVQKIK
jgi:Ca2+-binding EF-hand superfamily protein